MVTALTAAAVCGGDRVCAALTWPCNLVKCPGEKGAVVRDGSFPSEDLDAYLGSPTSPLLPEALYILVITTRI